MDDRASSDVELGKRSAFGDAKVPKWLEDLAYTQVSHRINDLPMMEQGFPTIAEHSFIPPQEQGFKPDQQEMSSELATKIPTRLFFTSEKSNEEFLLELMKKKTGSGEVRHGRRASQGAPGSPTRQKFVGSTTVIPGALLSRSADYVQRRNSSLSNIDSVDGHPEFTPPFRFASNRKSEQQQEEYWNNLSFFNHTQRGRLSARPEQDICQANLEMEVLNKPYLDTGDGEPKPGYEEHDGEHQSALLRDLQRENEALTKIDQLFKNSLQKSNLSDLVGNQLKDLSKEVWGNAFNLNLNDYNFADSDLEPDEYKSHTSEEIEEFSIPEQPMGRVLEIIIHSTWGDPHYVGLNGIEVFANTGEPAPIVEITADPADINTLPGYNGDPRVATNLLDGVNLTRDDMHMWLAPFTEGHRHSVRILFSREIKLAMIRIWNYNKSRVHSYRGARYTEMHLDGSLIFIGEIARACGGDKGSPKSFGDTILFTTDDLILEEVSKHDKYFAFLEYNHSLMESYTEASLPVNQNYDTGSERPFTKARGAFSYIENNNKIQNNPTRHNIDEIV